MAPEIPETHSASATAVPHIGCCGPYQRFLEVGCCWEPSLLSGYWHYLWCCSRTDHPHPAVSVNVLTASFLGTARNLLADKQGSQKEARDLRASAGAREGRREADCCQWQEGEGMSYRSLPTPNQKGGHRVGKAVGENRAYQVLFSCAGNAMRKAKTHPELRTLYFLLPSVSHPAGKPSPCSSRCPLSPGAGFAGSRSRAWHTCTAPCSQST